MPRVRSKRRFYDRGAEEEGRGDDDDREKWRVKSDHSLSLSLSEFGWSARLESAIFSPFFFSAREVCERERERERGRRARDDGTVD